MTKDHVMSTGAPFGDLAARTERELRTLADRIAKLNAIPFEPLMISTNDIKNKERSEKQLRHIKEFTGKESGLSKFVYVITAHPSTNLEKVATAFEREKEYSSKAAEEDARRRAYTRLNKKNPKSQCLYVGQSEQPFKRLLDHLGHGAKGTYALHLSYWATPLNLELTIHCAGYSAGISAPIIQALEDQLWDELKPMFGRRGPR